MRWGCSTAHPAPSRLLGCPWRRFNRRSNVVGANATSPTVPARSAPRTDQLSAPAPVSAAFAATPRATVAIIAELNRQIADLETTLAEHFETHPDADIYLSLPGLGVVLGARVLGEFGDD